MANASTVTCQGDLIFPVFHALSDEWSDTTFTPVTFIAATWTLTRYECTATALAELILTTPDSCDRRAQTRLRRPQAFSQLAQFRLPNEYFHKPAFHTNQRLANYISGRLFLHLLRLGRAECHLRIKQVLLGR